MSYKLLIADADPEVCRQIQTIVQNKRFDLDVTAFSDSGAEFRKALFSLWPNIVLADMSMFPSDDSCGEIFMRSGSRKLFIAMSSERSFEYAYKVIKYGGFGFLLKPLDLGEVCLILQKAVVRLEHEKKNYNHNYEDAIKHLFLTRNYEEMQALPKSISVTNSMFGFHFSEGLFRMVDLKIDCFTRKEELSDYIDSLMRESQRIFDHTFDIYCHELISDRQINSVQILLNYDPQYDSVIIDQFAECLGRIKKLIVLNDTVDVTFCVSMAHSSFSELAQAKKEMSNAYWSRLTKGTGQVLYWADAIHYPDQLFDTLEVLGDRVKRACEVWNIEEFRTGMDEFFRLPTQILGQEAGRVFIRDIETYMLNVNREEISMFSDVMTVKNQMRARLSMSRSIIEYKDVFVSEIITIFEKILESHKTQSTKAVRQAIVYVKSNYNQELHLENVSQHVHLSAVYFSALFKRETGQNFTSYVTNYRITIAKDLLRNCDLKIGDIAAAVGFTDQKYFSKTFSKIVGLKPTQYKKLFEHETLP